MAPEATRPTGGGRARAVTAAIVIVVGALVLLNARPWEKMPGSGNARQQGMGSELSELDEQELVAPHDAKACAEQETDSADVDGDGLTDLVYHDWIRGGPVVGVCTGDGSMEEMDGLGMSELLQIIDVQGDGRDEIFYGATSILGQSSQIAVFLRGKLETVALRGGRPLLAESGIELPLSGPGQGLAFGCQDVDGDGRGELVQVVVQRKGDKFYWARRAYEIEESRAALVSAQRGTRPARGDELAMAKLARELTTPCHVEAGG